eukprot:913665_1
MNPRGRPIITCPFNAIRTILNRARQYERTHHSHYDYNIKRAKKKMVHENIGSNSSLDDGEPHVTYTTNLNSGASKLKRRRGTNNKVSRLQSGYSTSYKRHKKRANRYIMDSRSNPSVRHQHNHNGDRDVVSR